MLFFQPLNDMRESVCGITIMTNHNNTNLKGKKKDRYTLAPRQLKQPEREYSKVSLERLSFQNIGEISLTRGTEILLCKIVCGDIL